MTTLLLVRHGETDWNAERRWQGHADVPLNARGRAQAQTLAEQLAAGEPVSVVYTSDLARARDTAEIVARRLGVEVVPDRDLREIDVGSRQGRTWSEIDDAPAWDGEPKEAHARRIVTALLRIATAHDRERVLVVTHGGSVRRVLEHVGAESEAVANCSIWKCIVADGVLRPPA
ncbi:MAG TPA: histidine phosphatase family protein [Gaiellaceae bacterium]|nr:histidine phosphatase family protein [Gaiellaceae bacterium]